MDEITTSALNISIEMLLIVFEKRKKYTYSIHKCEKRRDGTRHELRCRQMEKCQKNTSFRAAFI